MSHGRHRVMDVLEPAGVSLSQVCLCALASVTRGGVSDRIDDLSVFPFVLPTCTGEKRMSDLTPGGVCVLWSWYRV